ncbi:unnamed protein product [Arabidopsis arenosa]|uniref:Protein kinase domain-containing protein n=1 Tax=Arabidopsis arenosa TaxID=38785 RepID=A0A8S2AEU6_ARAAE|nr:unnamed protein product [Arabidopsis arenosa]
MWQQRDQLNNKDGLDPPSQSPSHLPHQPPDPPPAKPLLLPSLPLKTALDFAVSCHRDLDSATGGFDINNLLGRGSHGSVYKGVIGSRLVAVKRPSKSREISREFHNEFEILSRIRSPRFVNLLGFSADNSKEPLLVVEFMGNGSLYDVIHSDSVLNSGAISSWKIISGRKAIDVRYSPSFIVDWAIPMIKRGKIGGIYDPRIGPPIDVSVRNHLGLVAAKCVRTCREKRPGMEEVVGWLTGLTKSVRSRRWDDLSIGNPCWSEESHSTSMIPILHELMGVQWRFGPGSSIFIYNGRAEEDESNDCKGMASVVYRRTAGRVVKGAGHDVPKDQPIHALNLFSLYQLSS